MLPLPDRDRLLDAIDALAACPVGDRRKLEARHRNARALAMLVPRRPRVCTECEVGGGLHAEGCSLAPQTANLTPV
jgi:hypothetical protein